MLNAWSLRNNHLGGPQGLLRDGLNKDQLPEGGEGSGGTGV